MSSTMTLEQLEQEYAALSLGDSIPDPFSLILARTLALQVHHEEKSVGDLFELLDSESAAQLSAEQLSQLAYWLEKCWNWLETTDSKVILDWLSRTPTDHSFQQQRLQEAILFLLITLGDEQEQLYHYEESRVERMTEVVRAFKELKAVAPETDHDRQLLHRSRNLWSLMLECRETDEEAGETLLTYDDQVYLVLREVHAEGSWQKLTDIFNEFPELAADYDPTTMERLQQLDRDGHNLLKALPPEMVALIDTTLQLVHQLKEVTVEEPQSSADRARQLLARMLLYHDERSVQARDQLLTLGKEVYDPLRQLLGDVLCQHVIGPGYGLNFNRLIELAGELEPAEFKAELIALLDTTVPSVLTAVGELMGTEFLLFSEELQQLLAEEDHDLTHYNILLVLEAFPEEERLIVGQRLVEQVDGEELDWVLALFRLLNSIGDDAAGLVDELMESSSPAVRLQLEQLQKLQQRRP